MKPVRSGGIFRARFMLTVTGTTRTRRMTRIETADMGGHSDCKPRVSARPGLGRAFAA